MQILEYPVELQKKYLGLITYDEALSIMEGSVSSSKKNQATIWGLEHPLTYTAGLKTERGHILSDIPVRPARRGGSVTLHNPGQLVVYFAFPLESIRGGLERFVRVLESCIAETLLTLGVDAHFVPGASGVFTHAGKIAFIGLGLKKGFIYHGVAINIANNIDDYRAIQSCGLTLPMTRLADFNPDPPALPVVFDLFYANLAARLTTLKPAEFRETYGPVGRLPDDRTAFRLGWLRFHERRYWEAHEIWEFFWHEMPSGDVRIFFHAMIQVAMAWYKLFDAPNLTGAQSLLTKALEKLRVVRGIEMLVNQADFLAFIEKTLLNMTALAESGEEYSPATHGENYVPPVMQWI